MLLSLLLLLTSPSHLRTQCCLPFYCYFQNRRTAVIAFTLLTCHNRICILNLCQKRKHESALLQKFHGSAKYTWDNQAGVIDTMLLKSHETQKVNIILVTVRHQEVKSAQEKTHSLHHLWAQQDNKLLPLLLLMSFYCKIMP